MSEHNTCIICDLPFQDGECPHCTAEDISVHANIRMLLREAKIEQLQSRIDEAVAYCEDVIEDHGRTGDEAGVAEIVKDILKGES